MYLGYQIANLSGWRSWFFRSIRVFVSSRRWWGNTLWGVECKTKGVKNREFATKVKSILQEKKKHPQTCIKLAKQNATSES